MQVLSRQRGNQIAVPNARLLVGDTEIVALVDAVPDPVPPAWSFPEVPAGAWTGSAAGSLDEAGCFRPNLGCFAVRTPDGTLLVDLGIGPGPNAYLNGLRGRLPDRLAEAGLAFGDVAAVAFTHLHMDHVGWAVTGAAGGEAGIGCPGVPHYVAADELAYWQNAPESAGGHHREAFRSCVAPLVGAGLVRTVDDGEPFLPGIAFLATPGHTPAHRSVTIATGEGTVAIAGDVFHCPAQVAEPDWCHRADGDPALARATRRAFLAQAAEGGWLIAAGHFRDGAMFGRIEALRRGYRFVPAGPGAHAVRR